MHKNVAKEKDLSKIYKEPLKLKLSKQPIENWVRELKRYLTKESTKMANKHLKRCSTSSGK